MKTFRLLATSLLVALSMGISFCGDDVNEIIQQEPDNILVIAWNLQGQVKEGETLTLMKITLIQKSENKL